MVKHHPELPSNALYVCKFIHGTFRRRLQRCIADELSQRVSQYIIAVDELLCARASAANDTTSTDMASPSQLDLSRFFDLYRAHKVRQLFLDGQDPPHHLSQQTGRSLNVLGSVPSVVGTAF